MKENAANYARAKLVGGTKDLGPQMGQMLTFLEGMMTGTEKSPSEISDFKEGHTDTTVHFTVIAKKENIDAFEKAKDGLYGKFKLSTTISTKNMTLFDDQGKIHKYKSVTDILKMFFHHRLEFYVKVCPFYKGHL